MDNLICASGSPYLELLREAFASQRDATVKALSGDAGSGAMRVLMRNLITSAGRYAGEAVRLEPPVKAIACGKGCDHCCSATVGVLAPEALFLAEEIRSLFAPEALSFLKARASRLRRRLVAMDRGGRLEARMPCALLRNGACSAYEGRPLACRWTNSPSLQDCLDVLVHRSRVVLEMEEVRYQTTQELWLGLRAGLRDLGLDGSLLALDAALAIALAQPDAADRYLRGEPVFFESRLD